MRAALISDIHANEIALRALLADIARVRADEIVCLGDVATLGPRPGTVIEILRECVCTCVMGNHGEFLVDAALFHTYSEQKPVIEAVEWCRSGLARADLEFVRGFQRTCQIRLDDRSTLPVFHGSPLSNRVDILATTSTDELDELLAGHVATVMAGGHTRVQVLRRYRGTLLVNPGSVGLPIEEYITGRAPTLLTDAEYATVEAAGGRLSVRWHRVPLDCKSLREAAQASDVPLRDLLVQQYS